MASQFTPLISHAACPIAQIKIPTWDKSLPDATMPTFLQFAESMHQMLDNFFAYSEPTSHDEKSQSLFYDSIPPDIMRKNTGLTVSQVKCFPRTKNQPLVIEFINLYKKWSTHYKDFVADVESKFANMNGITKTT